MRTVKYADDKEIEFTLNYFLNRHNLSRTQASVMLNKNKSYLEHIYQKAFAMTPSSWDKLFNDICDLDEKLEMEEEYE